MIGCNKQLNPNVQSKRLAEGIPRPQTHAKHGSKLTARSKDGARMRVVCPATIDDPEISTILDKMMAGRTFPPVQEREQLANCVKIIDNVNNADPKSVPFEGRDYPYRRIYSQWMTDWVKKLEPNPSDELIILARGKNIESWKLATIKRDDYSPNAAGTLQWENDRKRWLANRLGEAMREAGYEDSKIKFVQDAMMDRNIPDPMDIREYDLRGPLGTTNFRILEIAHMIQVLRDAEALVFLERSFPQMFQHMAADEILAIVKRELAKISQKAVMIALRMPMNQVQRGMVLKAMEGPGRYKDIMGEMEGVAAASTHPGDWRYRDFDYE